MQLPAATPHLTCPLFCPRPRRKPVWARLQSSAMQELLAGRFEGLTPTEAYQVGGSH